MKILFYSHSSTVYGAPSSLVNLVSGLRRYHPHTESMVIIPSAGPLKDELDRLGILNRIIPHYRWTYSHSVYSERRKKSVIIAWLWLLKNVSTRLLKNLFHFPQHVGFCRQFQPDFIYVNSSTAPMGLCVGLLRDVKVICHHRETINDPVTGFFLDFGKEFSGKLLRRARFHIYPSEFLKASYSWLGARTSSLVQFNGVYFRNEISPNNHTITTNKAWRFSMVGRISEQKGQAEIIHFFKRIGNDFELNIYGSGLPEYVGKLKVLSQDANINFMGFKGRDEIFANSDFVIINAKNESFGRVVAEANAYGIPVFVIASGALAEIVKHNVNGFQFADLNGFTAFFEEMMLNYKLAAHYSVLQQNSRLFFDANFSIEAYSNRIFQDVLQTLYK